MLALWVWHIRLLSVLLWCILLRLVRWLLEGNLLLARLLLASLGVPVAPPPVESIAAVEFRRCGDCVGVISC